MDFLAFQDLQILPLLHLGYNDGGCTATTLRSKTGVKGAYDLPCHVY